MLGTAFTISFFPGEVKIRSLGPKTFLFFGFTQESVCAALLRLLNIFSNMVGLPSVQWKDTIIHFCKGCSVLWRDTISTVGHTISIVWVYYQSCEGIPSLFYQNCSYRLYCRLNELENLYVFRLGMEEGGQQATL